MSLKKCPDCGAEVSDKAQTCIKCGSPLTVESKDKDEKKKESSFLKNFLKHIGEGIGIIIALLVILKICGIGPTYIIEFFNLRAPKCGDETAQATVIEIIKEQLMEYYSEEFLNEFQFSLETVYTQSIDDNTGNCSCRANLKLTSNDWKNTVPIQYETIAGESFGEFMVNVSGQSIASLPRLFEGD